MVFEGLNNTRDLGGVPAAGGKTVKPGRLFRSSQLFKATVNDIRTLQDLGLTKVIDLRSEEERREKPDPELKGTGYIFIPVLRDLAAGIRRDEKAEGKAVESVISHGLEEPGFSERYMCGLYRDLVTDPYIVSQYSRFVRELMTSENERVLWHCTAGKDRAGFAAVIVLKLLGVSDEDILKDYLLTQPCLAGEVEELIRRFVPPGAPAALSESVRTLFCAKQDFLDALYAAADEKYGSFQGFISTGLKVGSGEISRLRSIYLE